VKKVVARIAIIASSIVALVLAGGASRGIH
jgi:predicted acylesterase/phospholipase RssA